MHLLLLWHHGTMASIKQITTLRLQHKDLRWQEFFKTQSFFADKIFLALGAHNFVRVLENRNLYLSFLATSWWVETSQFYLDKVKNGSFWGRDHYTFDVCQSPPFSKWLLEPGFYFFLSRLFEAFCVSQWDRTPLQVSLWFFTITAGLQIFSLVKLHVLTSRVITR